MDEKKEGTASVEVEEPESEESESGLEAEPKEEEAEKVAAEEEESGEEEKEPAEAPQLSWRLRQAAERSGLTDDDLAALGARADTVLN